MSAELFLEIGSEEIPAGFLPKAMADLERLMRKELESARISFGQIATFATPRRIALSVQDVDAMQQRQEVTATGPSTKVAFDAEGNPTRAAQGFARSNGVEVSELSRTLTDKGEYLYISKVIEGRPTQDLLPEMVKKVVEGLSFKKSMRWKDLDVRFARPVQWIVALYGGKVLPFSFGNIETGNLSRGHRFMAPDAFEVQGVESYLAETKKRFVMADPVERRATIAAQVEEAARREGAQLNRDEELLDEVTYLVEWPSAVTGTFEDKYLVLPRELLITSMREHQRYFTLSDAEGKLLPRFVTIANTLAKNPALVAQGNERVIRPRLADAMFFWNEDQKVSLVSRLESLKTVVYQAKLGSSYEKVMRFQAIAQSLAAQFAPETQALTARAALLAKCDLVSAMVFEFTELQGIMGREYARIEGEDERVAKAIHEHYLPIAAGGELPGDDVGAFVSIADKIDTICGCFGVGLIPTGTADPYALRRGAIGILNIILDRGYALSLPALVDQALVLMGEKLTRPAAEVRADVLEFLKGRFFNMLTGQDVAQDVVDAALCAGFDQPLDALQRIEALAALKQKSDFEPLAVAFKRVGNIIKGGVAASVDPELFASPCETALFEALKQVQSQATAAIDKGDYNAALHSIATLRAPVDSFFDGVMVMDKDDAVRTNRLALLTAIARLFGGIADFSRIAD